MRSSMPLSPYERMRMLCSRQWGQTERRWSTHTTTCLRIAASWWCVRACVRVGERGRDREHERELGRVLPTARMPEIRWNVAHAYLRSASFAAQFSSAQAAVSKDWRLLEFATDEVKGDKSVAIAALSEDPRAWKFIAASLYSEPDVVACRASSLERVEVQTAAALSQLECQ